MIKLNTTILCFCTLLISASCFAQENEKKAFVSIGGDVAFPTQKFSKLFKPGFGGSIKGAVPLNSKSYFTLTTGYLSFNGKFLQDG